ncbi:MAG: hypothetical protein B6D64_14365 [Bacteroidetes bacterium 4484_276]|nr:MAG: hypothetical protein B6D64_14365 [Bacteroidetes bacterium 4484_276]
MEITNDNIQIANIIFIPFYEAGAIASGARQSVSSIPQPIRIKACRPNVQDSVVFVGCYVCVAFFGHGVLRQWVQG